MCRVSHQCLCTLLTSVPSCLCALYRPVCWTSLHPFEILFNGFGNLTMTNSFASILYGFCHILVFTMDTHLSIPM